ncbi:MAG: pilus assembly protein TadG-related protein [Terriglobia bacterium]
MNQHNKSFLRRARKDERGQTLILVAFMMVMLVGFAALTVDFGRVYLSYRELQAATDAAALAGAEALPNGTGVSTATSYSGVSGNNNAYTNLPNVTMVSGYPLVKCLTTLSNQGIACVSPSNGNAIQVKQSVTVPMTFAKVVGFKSFTLTASATAAMRGAAPVPYNVAIVVDSTQSMTDSDGGSNCSGTREACALAGIQTLLGELAPCSSSESSCGTATANSSGGGAEVKNPVDQVSLLTFPAVTSATAPDDYNCGRNSPTVQPYPLPTGPNYTPASTPTYQIVNFSTDYRTSDTATSLNTSSALAIAAGAKTGCTGLQAIGGEGTYYAGVIYSAESLLVTEQASGTQNALILISDGEAQATCTTHSGNVCTSGPLTGASTKSVANGGGTYPSTVQQCHQAITAAAWAATQGTGGTKVYAVAYGGESSGCTTDTSPTITPCQTMRQIASSPAYFYTDYSSSSNSCVSASQPTTTLNQIFTMIGESFTVARLIPDNTT